MSARDLKMNANPQKIFKSAFWIVVVIVGIVGFLVLNPITIIPAGHVGVKDFFGNVSPNKLKSGVYMVIPFTKVVKMSVKIQEVKEVAEVPSREGLIMDLEVSLLFKLDSSQADGVYKTVGSDYREIIVVPQFRSAIREVTASYEAKSLYSAEREKIASEIFSLCEKLMAGRGITAEQILLRRVGLPTVVANAIQEKLRREQEAEQMKFVLQKEQQEAERKRIEAQGIADFQRIVSQDLNPQLLEWKGIEATEKLAQSTNAKVVIVGNPKNGLPVIIGNESR